MKLARATLIWVTLAIAVGVPIAAAAVSPLLAWRDPIYILAGFAGIVALGLALAQPLLIGGYLPGLPAYRGRRVHHFIGGTLVVAVVVHVAGLWFTSPPDMIDALLFSSPTPFSPWGVTAMWAIFAVDWGCDRNPGASRTCPSRWSSSQAAWSMACWSRGQWRQSRRRRFAHWCLVRRQKS